MEVSEPLPQAQPPTSNTNTTDEKLEKLIHVMTDISTKLSAVVQAEITQPSPLEPLFGTPAVTTFTEPVLQGLDLTNKNILWTKVHSGNHELPLPIDTGCSLSLVSASHADFLLVHNEKLTFTPLKQHIPITVANPKAQLKATGLFNVPLTFADGSRAHFTMLVVPHLTWTLLFGINHVKSTKALIDGDALAIQFPPPKF